MVKDDRTLKTRLRLCPFCGSDHLSTAFNYMRGIAFISCDHCYAQGPEVSEVEVIRDDVICNMDAVKREMIDRSADRWNCRPPMTNVTPEELEDLEKYAKTDSAALYGASVYEEVKTDG